MKKNTSVWLATEFDCIHGFTMEDACPSPTSKNPNRMVVRIKWDDETETIENIEDLDTDSLKP